MRDDALATRRIASEETDKIMWQAMYALTEARETARLQEKSREDDARRNQRNEDRRTDLIRTVCIGASLVLSVVSLVLTILKLH